MTLGRWREKASPPVGQPGRSAKGHCSHQKFTYSLGLSLEDLDNGEIPGQFVWIVKYALDPVLSVMTCGKVLTRLLHI